ncbi:MAG: phospholipase D-like domain-containing protein [Desulfurivibrionaceae bacterium]|nr:phospholipase D-like domain-containing protein [Desulfobulbales bacterium]MDT8335253.1 phospholipase D-like domain-containing protein [Desulfurivibrionaceae bacterium]
MAEWKDNKKILPLILFGLLFGALYGTAEAERLNINTATTDELTSLPYIGTIRAGSIIACRHEHGPFKDLNELLICDGIGAETLRAMRADLEALGDKDNLAPGSTGSTENEAAEPETASGDIRILSDADYFPILLKKIRAAQNSIDLTMFVFKTTNASTNRPRLVVEELRAAARRGVKVRVFLEESGYDENLNKTNRQTAEKLRGKGIEVFFDSPAVTTHSKLVVTDRRFSFVGSHNLTHAALTYNNELSLLVDDPGLAQNLTAYMEGIISR